MEGRGREGVGKQNRERETEKRVNDKKKAWERKERCE